jgi:hypothetical protein
MTHISKNKIKDKVLLLGTPQPDLIVLCGPNRISHMEEICEKMKDKNILVITGPDVSPTTITTPVKLLIPKVEYRPKDEKKSHRKPYKYHR